MFDFTKPLYDGDSGEIDWERLDPLIEEFLGAPEGKPFEQEGAGWVPLMFEYALGHIGSEPAEMTRRDMGEVLFQLFPRKVSTEAESAPAIIAELRAFWQFLGRQYALKNADAIVGMLDASAEVRLRKELADPANYGMAKSMFMQGRQAGFDMTTEEGLTAFMIYYNSRLGVPGLPTLPPMPLGPGPFALDDPFYEFGPSGPPPKQRNAAREKKRKARKEQRKSRKRNR